MKNKIKISLFALIIIGVIALCLTYKSKDKIVKTKKQKHNNLAIIISDESGGETSVNEIPKGNYILNEEKTHCENNGKVLSYDNNTGKVKFSFIGSDRCYLYFDYDEKPAINNVSVNNKILIATLSDDKELYGYQITSSNKIPKTWNEINGKTYNLSYTLTEPGRYYLWVKDSSGNVSNSIGKTGITMSLKNYIVNKYTNENLIKERTDFTTVYDETNDYLFKTTSSQSDSTLYYYAGNTQNNWVKFGEYPSDWNECKNVDGSIQYKWSECTSEQTKLNRKPKNAELYWRIIRTDDEEGIRLLYSGTGPRDQFPVIASSIYNPQLITVQNITTINSSAEYFEKQINSTEGIYDKMFYVNDSITNIPIKILGIWFQSIFGNPSKYINENAIYCNDRENYGIQWIDKDNGIASKTFNGYYRLNDYKEPIYKCLSSTSNGQIIGSYGIMTADELAMAGAVFDDNKSLKVYYTVNSLNEYIQTPFWTMTPAYFDGVSQYIFYSGAQGQLFAAETMQAQNIRPVISLNSCVNFLSGDGSPDAPYEIDLDSCS